MLEFLAKLLERVMQMDYHNEGWSDYFFGFNLEDNPYDEGTYAAAQWEQGWTAAEDYAFKDDENFI